jgi:hypothetical protein
MFVPPQVMVALFPCEIESGSTFKKQEGGVLGGTTVTVVGHVTEPPAPVAVSV